MGGYPKALWGGGTYTNSQNLVNHQTTNFKKPNLEEY